MGRGPEAGTWHFYKVEVIMARESEWEEKKRKIVVLFYLS